VCVWGRSIEMFRIIIMSQNSVTDWYQSPMIFRITGFLDIVHHSES
jgi:hypothetical protein